MLQCRGRIVLHDRRYIGWLEIGGTGGKGVIPREKKKSKIYESRWKIERIYITAQRYTNNIVYAIGSILNSTKVFVRSA